MSERPNRLGWITSLNYDLGNDLIEVAEYNGSVSYLPAQTSVDFEIRGRAANAKGLFMLFDEWMNNGIQQPVFKREWRCLYCTSPNSINKTHCTQCGAPRNFVLG